MSFEKVCTYAHFEDNCLQGCVEHSCMHACVRVGTCGEQVFDVETGLDDVVLNLNPAGWIPGVTKEKDWLMLYGLDVSSANNLIITGWP
jgi:hypothetical protein